MGGDISEQIQDLQNEVPDWIKAARETLLGDEPCISPGDQCHKPFDCSFFGYCSPIVEDPDIYPPEVLPYGRALAATLRSEGYTDLRDVPEERLDNWKHQRVWRVTKSDQAELNPEAGRLIAALPYPRYYIDFETINPAVPVWAGTRPYMQVPFQWSCHTETSKGVMKQSAFLADGLSDPRRPFAESLIDAVGTDGPIFVYNASFERSRMQEIAEYYPDLAPALQAAIDRIVDLLPIAREHYYHPGMCGSWSIKAVLPTIAPDLAYDNLELADGGMAQDAFAEMMLPETTSERREQLHKALLLYCERDTLAMVRIAHYFEDGGMAHKSNGWSAGLVEETRKALQDVPVTLDGNLHMKNFNGSFGEISLDNLLDRKLLIMDNTANIEYPYASAEELIAAGWAID